MTSFQTPLTPSKRAAARLVSRVRRAILKAYAIEQQKTGVSQSEIARRIGVHRSVINRELRGTADLTLSRVGQLAEALGREAVFELREKTVPTGSNRPLSQAATDRKNSHTPQPGIGAAVRPRILEVAK